MAYYTAGIVGPYVRNALTPSTFDISGGNISNSGTTTSANATISGRIQTPGSLDISAGTLSNSVRILTGSGTAAAPSYTFGTDASMGLYDPATNVLGFATSGLERMRIASDGNVGVGKTPTTALDVSGTMQTTDAIISGRLQTLGVMDISGGNITVTGVITAGAVATSGIAPTNIVVPGYIRNAIPATTLDISGGNISNSGTTRSSNFIGAAAASNQIGGVTLNNGNISNDTYSSNSIGGVTLGSYAITTEVNASNSIGGVTLTNSTVTTDPYYSNYIGGVTLSNYAITTDVNVSNYIGGVTLSNTNISNSGRITTGAGTAAAPSYTFGGDTAMGLYDPAANVLGLVTSGTERMRIAADGKVGISCNAPQNTLDISTNLTFDGIRMTGPSPVLNMYVRGTEANGNTMQFFANSTSGGITQFDNARRLTLNTGINNTPRLVIGTNGNVAIGSGHTGPEVPLDVSGTADYLAVFRGSGGTQAGIWVTNGAGAATTTGIQLYQNSSGQGLFTSGTNAQPMHFWTSATRRMTILNTGDVGIGTTAPATTLDISSSLDPMITLRNRGGNATLRILGGAVTQDTCGMQIYHGSSEQGIFNSNVLPFHIQTNAVRRLTILSNGNVGVGTTVPVTRLQVNPKVVDDQSYVYDISAMMVVQPKGTGATVLNDPTAVMYLARQGTSAQSFGAMAALKLSRFENADTNSRTRLDFDLTHGFFNDVNVMTMRSDGRVGIGTTAPVAPLDISASGGIFFRAGNVSGYVSTSVDAGSYGVLRMNGGLYMFQPGVLTTTNPAVQIQNENNGRTFFGSGVGGYRVGVGTSNPLASFHVIGASNDASHGIVCIENDQARAANVGAGLSFKARYHATLGVPSVIMGKIDALKLDNANYSDSFMSFSTRSEINWPTGGAGELRERMRLTNILPGDVSTNVLRLQTQGIKQATRNQIDFCSLEGSSPIDVARIAGLDVAIGAEVYRGNLTLSTRLGVDQVERMRLTHLGVGIGTSNPAYTLDVCAGPTVASINMSTWPRFAGSTIYTGTYLSRNTDVINWTTVTAIDTTNLMSVITGTGYGTYYIIKKSGIWNIQFRTTGPSANNWNYGISFSNTNTWVNGNFSSNLIIPVGLGNNEGGAFAAFTGYLPSNATTTYKAWVTAGNTPSAGSIVITFLGEIPTTFANPL